MHRLSKEKVNKQYTTNNNGSNNKYDARNHCVKDKMNMNQERKSNDNQSNSCNTSCDDKVVHKKIRRSMKNKKKAECITLMYSNIQGITKKRESLMNIVEVIDADICLLAETLTNKIKIEGCRCIPSRKPIGQNVCIILRKNLASSNIMKLYEPNEVANMLGIRVELMNTGLRVYTAHLKQQSTNSRDDIRDQFEEVRKQFKYANSCEEGIVMVFDANVHVGDTIIKGCTDKQDWGGKLIRDIIKEENLVLVNAADVCTGVITRVDPRNGNGSTIDLVVCNRYVSDKILNMVIDEKDCTNQRIMKKK